jgi:hypothetical protein
MHFIHVFIHFNSCHLYILAHNLDPIHLQVEMDILSMSHTTPDNPERMACMIFKVSLNRPTKWANNGSMSCLWIYITPKTNFLVGKTWRGDIGVMFDTENKHWDLEVYNELIESLTSCFWGPNEVSVDS